MRGGSGRNCPRRPRPKRTKSKAQVGGEGGRTWAATLNGARRRSSRRAPTQAAFTAGGAGGKPRHRCKRAVALLLSWAQPRFWCWSRRRSRRAAARVGSRRWLQGAGDGGGGRKEMDFFVTCLKLCCFFAKKQIHCPVDNFSRMGVKH